MTITLNFSPSISYVKKLSSFEACLGVTDLLLSCRSKYFSVFEVNPNKSYKCADKNTGKKINSTLGWSLGFREKETEFKFINTRINMVADASLNEIASDGIYFGMFGNCIWNELGTKYLILEVDDFNRNRNSGNMGTMSMPTCTENFKIPNYAKNISQIYPICDPSDNIQRFPDPEILIQMIRPL